MAQGPHAVHNTILCDPNHLVTNAVCACSQVYSMSEEDWYIAQQGNVRTNGGHLWDPQILAIYQKGTHIFPTGASYGSGTDAYQAFIVYTFDMP